MTEHERQITRDLEQLAGCLKHYADQEEQRLRTAYPTLTAYLELTILARPLWGGGFDVLGEVYATAGAAEEARLTAIMLELSRHDRVMTCK